MALMLLREIASVIQKAPFFTVMVGETTDSSNKEQVAITIRYVTESFDDNKELIGFYQVDSIDVATLKSVIKDSVSNN